MGLICKLFGHDTLVIRQKDWQDGQIKDSRYIYCKRCKRLFKQPSECSFYYERLREIEVFPLLTAIIKQVDSERSDYNKAEILNEALKFLEVD